jgi:hypothetical protein
VLDDVFREHVSLEQEVMVILEGDEGGVERARDLRHLGQLLGGQLVEVLVEGLGWIQLVLDPVDARHQHRGER